MKTSRIFLSESFHILAVKFSIYMYLNRHVCVMMTTVLHYTELIIITIPLSQYDFNIFMLTGT